MSECVKVMVRARPINQREINEGTKMCIEIDKRVNQVIIKKGTGEDKAFSYDSVYDWNSTQRSVYDESAFPLVESVLEGYNGTIFAYGQTGCGKTHTMMGLKDGGPEHRGIIPNAFDHIFGFIGQCHSLNTGQMKFLVRCSYLEIYNEDIRDLLNSKQNLDNKLELKEDPNKGGVYVKDLTCCIVKSIPEIEKLMTYGTSQRKTGETAMNKDSSRSHSIFTIYIETSETDQNGESRIKAGKLNLVDLAGSERQSKTQAQGIRLKEATKINLSLSALGNVISALVDGKSQHIPYRDSKLTRLLQDSLGGNTKTVMIAAISPSDFNYEESLSTLRYAARAKSIQNKPRVNEDPKDALLKQYEEEIKKLKQLLDQNGGNPSAAMINIQNAAAARRQESIITNVEEDSVDQLLEKLAKKGKKVKIINERESQPNLAEEEVSPNLANRKLIQKKGRSQNNAIAEVDNEDEDQAPAGFSDQLPPTSGQQLQQKKSKSKRTIIRESTEAPQNKPPVDLQAVLNEAALSKDQLQQMIKEMEQRLVVGGSESNVVESQEDKERIRQQRALQIKLRNEKKKQKTLMEEKQKQEEELLLKQQQYSSLQEEVDQNRRIVEQLRSKYKQIAQELRDSREENEEHKEVMLETIREQEREIEFLNLVMKALLKDYELQNLREKSRYDDFNQRWVLPAFYVKDKVIQLPRVGIRNAESLMQTELDKRDFVIQGDIQNDSDENGGDRFDSTPGFGNTMMDGHGFRGGPSQKSQRGVMNDTYYNNTNGGGGFPSRKIGQGQYPRQGNAAVSEMMRQSRMSVGYDHSSLERGTPIESVKGPATGPRAGKYKQVQGGSRLTMDTGGQQEYTQFSTLGGGIQNSESELSLNKKNMKSNVHLQPLNYKSNLPSNAGMQNVAQGIEEILKNHQIQLSSVSQDGIYNQIPMKKNQLGKMSGGQQVSLNLNQSESGTTINGPTQGGGFQMSIQATVSIEPTNGGGYLAPRRPQLAPIQNSSPPQNPLKQVAMDNISQVRLNGAISGASQQNNQGNNNNNNNPGVQVFRKNRVFLSGVNNNNNNSTDQ